MVRDISEVCFLGVYSHNQDDVLRDALGEQEVSVTELSVPIRSVEEARRDKRPPIRTMRATINWFRNAPRPVFPILFLGVLIIHSVLTLLSVVSNFRSLRTADAIVVPHMGDTSVLLAKPLGIVFRIPVVYLSHNGLYFTMIRNRGLYPEDSIPARVLFETDRLLHTLADKVIVFSEESGDRFAETFGIPRDRYETIYISVVESNFEIIPKIDMSMDCDVLYWGNFHPHHGPRTMVKAAAKTPEKEFVFLGQSDKRGPVMELAERLNLQNVSFPGFVSNEELVSYIQDAEVVLGPVEDNPQTEFTIGTKVAEAAYLNKAIVLGANPAPMEVFDHGESAHLVQPGSADAVAAGVKEICDNKEYRVQLESGAERVYQRYFAPNCAATRFLDIAENAHSK